MNPLRPANLRKLADRKWLGEKIFQTGVRLRTAPPQSGSIEGFLAPIEERTIQWSVRHVPPGGKIVEVGSYKGKSAVNFAYAVRKRGGDATIFCVDTWRNENIEFAKNVDVFAAFEANVARDRDLIVPLRGRSEEVGAAWDRGPIDVLFIDGDHSYEGVVRDVEAWVPHVKPGGLVMFHDTGLEGVWKGIEATLPLLKPTRKRKAWSILLYWKG